MSVTAARLELRTQTRARPSHDDALLRAAGFAPSSGDATDRAQIEGIILAGVHTWGYSALDHFVCWPLVPIAGQPLLLHTIDWLASADIRVANVCANSDTLTVSRAMRGRNTHGVTLQYYEDRMPRGPAGCIGDVMVDRGAPTYVVVDGSILPRVDLGPLLRAHEESGAVVTIAATSGGECSPSSGRLSPIGIYVFSKEVAEFIGRVGYQDVKEKLIPRLHSQGLSVGTHVVDGCSLPRVRCAASYLTVSKWAMEFLNRGNGHLVDYRVRDGSRVHKTARIDSNAKLIGPVLVEADCVVESGALIVGPTTIGRGTVIGRDSVVSRTAIWSRCRLGAGTIVDDCVIADGVSLEAGSVQRNAVCVDRTSRGSRENR